MSRMLAPAIPAIKRPEIIDTDDSVGIDKTSGKPASKVVVATSPDAIEEPERGILPLVSTTSCFSYCVAHLHHRKCILVPFSSNSKASEDETMMDLKTFLSALLTKADRWQVHFT